jgi:hypothetical protein
MDREGRTGVRGMRETRIKALLERRAATALNIIDEASAVEGADFVMYTECRQVLGGMAQWRRRWCGRLKLATRRIKNLYERSQFADDVQGIRRATYLNFNHINLLSLYIS